MKRATQQSNKPGICIITVPFTSSVGRAQLANIIELLQPLSSEIFPLTGEFPRSPGENIHIVSLKSRKLYSDRRKISVWGRITRYILSQLELSLALFKISKKIDIVMFYIGSRISVLPVLLAKLLRKKVIVFANGSIAQDFKLAYGKRLFGAGIILSYLAGALENTGYSLADRVAVDFECIIRLFKLDRYKKKISIGLAPYINTNTFKVEKKSNERRNLVAYIGRLEPTKGAMNFVKAIPLLLEKRGDVEFLIAGDGSLFSEVAAELKKSGVSNKVKVTGGIPYEQVPYHLNEAKLLVFPSFNREGGAGIVKEGMSCGAVVVAPLVGGVPDLIKDGETGFILGDNSPECIAEGVGRALACEKLEEIAENARLVIERGYTYEAVMTNFRSALRDLTGSDENR